SRRSPTSSAACARRRSSTPPSPSSSCSRTGGSLSVNHAGRSLLAMKESDVGRPLQDLQVSYRPVELRSLIDEAHTGQRPVTTRDVAWAPEDAAPRNLDVHVAPVFGGDGTFAGTVVSFVDTT